MSALRNQSRKERYLIDILAVVSTADYYLHAYIHRSKEYSQVEQKSLSSHLRGVSLNFDQPVKMRQSW